MALRNLPRSGSLACLALSSSLALGGGIALLLLESPSAKAVPLGGLNQPSQLCSSGFEQASSCVRTKGGWLCLPELASGARSPAQIAESSCLRAKGGWLCQSGTATASAISLPLK